MALRWKIPFMGKNGTAYTVNIYDSTYTGTVTTLTGAADPFEVQEDDDDDIFTPVRTQSGYIRFIDTGDILRTMASGIPLQRQVMLVTSDNVALWIGYLSCEEYSQEYIPFRHEVEVPIISGLAALEGIYLSQATIGMRTINSYLDEIISAAGYDLTECVWAQPVDTQSVLEYKISALNWLSRRDEVDEDGNRYDSTTLLEVLSDLCAFFGITCREHYGVVYFTMSDVYTSSAKAVTFKSADNEESIIPGCHKFTVKSSVNNYDEDILPYSFDDCAPLTLESELNSIYSRTRKDTDYIHTLCNGTSGSKHLWFNDYQAGSHSSYGGALNGLAFRSVDDAATKYPSFTDYIVLAKGASGYINFTPKVNFCPNSACDLMIGISGDIKFSNYDTLPTQKDDKIRTLKARLRIGDWYYVGGTTWIENDPRYFYLYVSTEGKITLPSDLSIDIDDYWKYDSFDGYRIPLLDAEDHTTRWHPSGEVQFTIYAPESTFDYDFVWIADLQISVVKAQGILDDSTKSDKDNEYTKTVNNGYKDEKSIDLNLTTGIGRQWGGGVVMEDDDTPLYEVGYTYGTDYIAEKKLLTRMSTFYAQSHQKIVATVELDDTITPENTISINDTTFYILAVSKNYWESTMQLTLISA